MTEPALRVTAPVSVQRIESAAVSALLMIGTIVLYPSWWWAPLALFLLFDLSALGYLRSARAGAAGYNLVHNYTLPAALGILAVTTGAGWAGIVALAWGFHVAVDRALGYGLKHDDAFTHTHLGRIGRGRH